MLKRFFPTYCSTASSPPLLFLATTPRFSSSTTSATSSTSSTSSEARLQSLQKLPKLTQIARSLPSEWRTAKGKFQRYQFLEPNRPPTSPVDPQSSSYSFHQTKLRNIESEQPEIFHGESEEKYFANLAKGKISSSSSTSSQQPAVGDYSSSSSSSPTSATFSHHDHQQSEGEYQEEGGGGGGEQQQQQRREAEEYYHAQPHPLPSQPVARTVPDTRLRIALVGAVNAGKSALWNKLCAEFEQPREATRNRVPQLVKEDPGVTRDAIEGVGSLGQDCVFTIVDTPGVIDGQILDEAKTAIASCHAAIFVVACDRDIGRDEFVMAKYLEANARLPVVCVLSKSDLARHRLWDLEDEITSTLGVGRPVPVSSYTTSGFDTLAEVVKPIYDIQARVQTWRDWSVEDAALSGDEAALEEVRLRNTVEKPIRVAFIGRTNSGKSALVNCIVGKYRSRSRPGEGEVMTTRDTVETECVFRGKRLQLVDTAPSTRFRTRRDRDFLQQLHNSTLRAIKFADVCVVVFDARDGHPSNYDMQLAHMCVDEGRPFLFAANRWDQVMDASATAEAIDFKLKRQVNEVRYAHAVVTSSMHMNPTENMSLLNNNNGNKINNNNNNNVGLNLALLMKEVMVLHDNWNKKVSSKDLTRFWRKLEKSINVPMKNTRIHRIVQSHARPPTFVLRLQAKDHDALLKNVFTTLVRNALVEEFGFRGVPVRILQEVKDKHPDITI